MIKTIKQSLDDTAKNKLNKMGYTVDYSGALSSLYNPIQKTTKVCFRLLLIPCISTVAKSSAPA